MRNSGRTTTTIYKAIFYALESRENTYIFAPTKIIATNIIHKMKTILNENGFEFETHERHKGVRILSARGSLDIFVKVRRNSKGPIVYQNIFFDHTCNEKEFK